MIPSTDIERHIDKILETTKLLWEKGWAERNAGNISVRFEDNFSGRIFVDGLASFPIKNPCSEMGNHLVLITGSGCRMRDIARFPEANLALLKIDADGKSYKIVWGGKKEGFKPTSELDSHLLIHSSLMKNNPDLTTIVHTHPTELIALTHNPDYKHSETITNLLWSMIPETSIFVPEGVGVVPYQIAGSLELAKATIEVLPRYKAVLWEKHGCLAVGEDAIDAFDTIDVLNKSAQIFINCKNCGFEPEGISLKQINELRDYYNIR